MTDRIYISDYFNDNAKNIITEALKKTQLPEGVHVVGWNETEKAEKPFIVLVPSGQLVVISRFCLFLLSFI